MLALAVLCVLAKTGLALQGTTCNFSWDWDSTFEKRLQGQVAGSKVNVSLLQCIRSCLDLDSRVCRSINYNNQLRQCQLNRNDKRIGPQNMIVDPGWKYYHKRVSTPERISSYKGNHCYVKRCAAGTHLYNNQCIHLNVLPLASFTASLEKCKDRYGTLITIKDTSTWNALQPLLRGLGNQYKYYIGFKRYSGQLKWLDGSSIDTSQFFGWDQPDNYNNMDGPEDCGALEHMGGGFALNDVPCNLLWSCVCVYDKWVYSLW